MANSVTSIVEVIPQAQEILRAGSRLLKHTYDVSKFATKGSNSINYPTLAKATAQTKAVGLGNNFSVSNITQSNSILLLDKVIGDAFEIEIFQELQNKLNALEAQSKNVLDAMGEDFDKKIYLEMRRNSNARYVVPTSDIYADIVDLSKKLDDAFVPVNGRVLAISSADYAKLLKVKDFTRFDSVGNGDAIRSGIVGEVLGFTVVRLIVDLTDQTETAQQTFAYHPIGVTTAVQGDIKLSSAVLPLGTKTQYSLAELIGIKVQQVSGSVGTTEADLDSDNTRQSPYIVRLGAAPAAP